MAFVIPQFPLTCNVFTGGVISNPPRISPVCNLAWGRRSTHNGMSAVSGPGAIPFPAMMDLLVPAGTDLRDKFNSSSWDAVECPAGSGRFYIVVYVDDIGKGFPNEHRCGVLQKVGNALGFWPTPVP